MEKEEEWAILFDFLSVDKVTDKLFFSIEKIHWKITPPPQTGDYQVMKKHWPLLIFYSTSALFLKVAFKKINAVTNELINRYDVSYSNIILKMDDLSEV